MQAEREREERERGIAAAIVKMEEGAREDFRLLLLNFPAVSGLEVVVLARAHPHLLPSTKLT